MNREWLFIFTIIAFAIGMWLGEASFKKIVVVLLIGVWSSIWGMYLITKKD